MVYRNDDDDNYIVCVFQVGIISFCPYRKKRRNENVRVITPFVIGLATINLTRRKVHLSKFVVKIR